LTGKTWSLAWDFNCSESLGTVDLLSEVWENSFILADLTLE